MFRKVYGWLKMLFIITWLLLVLVLTAWIAYENQQKFNLTLLGFELPELTFGIYLSITFVTGAFIGWFGTWIVSRIKLFSGKRELKKTKKEIEKLRTAHLTE